MITKCPRCGGHVLTTSMTEDEEQKYAAAFSCTSCRARFVELWPEGRARAAVHVAIDEK
jgi:transcription elongation factor Elf1